MTSLPNVTATTTESLSVAEHLSQESHMLDVTVWLMIFCIFTFFFIIIVASICMHWMEVRRRKRKKKKLQKQLLQEARWMRGRREGGGEGRAAPRPLHSYSNPAMVHSSLSVNRL
ncbi:uncharacterized protein LOC123513235 isoform X2 [Portunus trituberculatus]|uniref:uncharacterized protein LOC123513235 isoform X2 n=1 Tax=Portunus trituberculatus TaxID=210409 RepID=UPI001E1CBFE9|nr:uncharacterized protein LOC123513235 isoform X2 [Portunus trituberculatus]